MFINFYTFGSRQERALNKTLSDIRFGVSRMQAAVGSTDNPTELEVSARVARQFLRVDCDVDLIGGAHVCCICVAASA